MTGEAASRRFIKMGVRRSATDLWIPSGNSGTGSSPTINLSRYVDWCSSANDEEHPRIAASADTVGAVAQQHACAVV